MIYLAADHGGFNLKEKLITWLKERGNEVEDMGAYGLNPEDDYPDFVIPLAEKVVRSPNDLGIIMGRSGNGEAIVANKVKGARAAVCLNEEMARKAREDNNANILSIGADYISEEEAKKIVTVFLETPFSDAERHVRRLEKVKNIESK